MFFWIQSSACFARSWWTSLMFLLFLRTVCCRFGFSFLSFGMTSCLRKFLGMVVSMFVRSSLFGMVFFLRYSRISFFDTQRSGRRTLIPFFLVVVSFIPESPLSWLPLMKFRRIVSRLSSAWCAVRT